MQKRWVLRYVGVQFYLMAKVLAVRTFNRPNNRLYANSNWYAIRNNKGDQVSSIAAIWANIITWSWAHQKKVLKASILIAQMMIKLGVSTTKIKYLTQIYMIDQNVSWRASCQRGLTQNQNESINNIIWSKCPKRVLCSKSRFVISVCEWNVMREYLEESHFWNH